MFLNLFEKLIDDYWLLGVVLLLALLNWNAEAYKLKHLIRSEIKLSQARAFFVTLGGMAISNFTPARTGEYIGRSLLLKGIHPVKVTIATITGNFTQVLYTYAIGLLALIAYLGFNNEIDYVDPSRDITLAILILGGLLVFLFNAKRIINYVLKRLPKKYLRTVGIIKSYDKQLFIRVTAASGIRYVIFSLQFFLLLYIFRDMGLPIEAMILVPVAYLMQTLVPIPAVSDLGIRMAVCQVLFGDWLYNDSLLMAVTSLWLINLILPGLLGTVYIAYSTLVKR